MNNNTEGPQGSANSKTPRTDKLWLDVYPHDQEDLRLERVFQHARQLERQLAQSEERVKALEGALVEAIRFAEMNDEQWEQEDCPSEKIASLKAALLSSSKTN